MTAKILLRQKILRRGWRQEGWTGRSCQTSSGRWSRVLPMETSLTCRCTAPRSNPLVSKSVNIIHIIH